MAGRFSAPIAIYTEAEPRFALLPVGTAAPGRYRLRLEFRTDRTDLPPEQLVQAAASSTEATVVLP
ncbi:MAG: hypothetical protein R2882_06685 [Gemmatimonadales bacterium]